MNDQATSQAPLVCGEWDLSVSATAGVSAFFVADALSNGISTPIGLSSASWSESSTR